MYFSRIYFIFGLLLFNLNLFSQTDVATIEIIHFNSTANYGPGSGVSVHIDPKGIYKMGNHSTLNTDDPENNKFVLELSDSSGSFSNPEVLAEVYTFYTPLLNGLIPVDTPPSSDYKIRVKATLGYTNPEYENVYSDADGIPLIIGTTSTSQNLDLTSQSSVNSNFFSCDINVDSSTMNQYHNPIFGSLNRALGATTGDNNVPSFDVLDLVLEFTDDMTYNVNLFDISVNGVNHTQGLNIVPNPLFPRGTIIIPDDITIGTYNVEFEQVDSSGVSSFYSLSFLWHSDNTNLGNTTTTDICLGVEVDFAIDNSEQGISRNYPNSYYSFDFGDGSGLAYYTHAQLMFENVISYTYDSTSCDIQGNNPSSFLIEKLLYNDFRDDDDDNCDFIQNGSGKQGLTNVSEAPEASFNLDSIQCETTPILAVNTSNYGQFGSSGFCEDEADFKWFVKWPGLDDFYFVEALVGQSWYVVNDDGLIDLLIPSDFVNGKPGCWEIYLTAENTSLCQTVSTAPVQTISIETSPDPDFNILYNGEIVTEICVNSTVLLDDNSNVSTIECQNPTYQWSISPSTGYSYVNETGPSSQNPEVLFTEAGLYTITQTITNTCGTNSIHKELTVLGSPSVEFSPNDDEICLVSDGLPYTVNFSNTFPNYSSFPYAPSSYSWTITGDDVSDSDYDFLNGTLSSSDYPIIRFNSFKDYIITVSVNGDCDDTNNDDFLLKINEIPEISNTDFILDPICSGFFSGGVPLSSTMPGETNFSWERIYEGSSTTFFGSTIPPEQIINLCNTPLTLIYRVTPSTEFCTGPPVDFSIQVNPKPFIPDQTAVICSGEEFFISPENNCPTTIVPVNTTYEWDVSDNNNNIEGASDSDPVPPGETGETEISQELTNISDIVQYVTYTVTPKSGASGACTGDTFDIVVQVDPEPIIDDIILDPICSGGGFTVGSVEGFTFDLSEISTNIVPSGTVYEWSVLPDDGPGTSQGDGELPADDSVAVIEQTDLEVGDTPVVLTYTVTPFAPRDNGGHCKGDSFNIVVQVNPKPVIPDQTAVICSGEEFIISPNNNSTNTIVPANTTYEWDVSDNNNIEGASDSDPVAPGETGETEIRQELTNISDIVQYVTYTVTPTSGASGACPGDTFDIVVQVDPEPIIEDIVLEPICSGGGFTVGSGEDFTFDLSDISANIVPSGTVYEWDVDSPGTPQGDGELPADDAVPVIEQTDLEVGDTPVVLTYTVTPFAPRENGGHCVGDSFDIVIQINPKPVIPNQTAVICSGEEFNFSLNDGNSYDWNDPVSTPDGSIQGGGPPSDPNITQTNISQTLTLNPGFNSPAILTYQVTSISPEGCDSEPFNIVVEVNPNGQVDQINDIVVCDGDNVEIEFTTQNTSGEGIGPGSGGRTDYQWEITNHIEIGQPYVGIGSNEGTLSEPPTSLNFTASNDLTAPIIANLKVTPTFDNNRECPGEAMFFTITVNPRPAMDQVESQTICSGTDFDAPIYNSDISGVDYSWTLVNAAAIAAFGSDISGYPQSVTYPVEGQLTGTNIINTSGVAITLEYELEVEYEGCEGNAVPFLVTVNPSPVVSISPSEPQFICSSGELNEICVSYTYPETIAVEYQWYYNTTDTNVVTTGVTEVVNEDEGGTSSCFTPDSLNSFDTRYYFCVLSFLSADSDIIVCNEEVSPTVEITVGNQPSILSNPEPEQTICLGGTVEEDSLCVTINGGVEDVEYTWRAGFTYLISQGFGIFPPSNSNCLELPEDYFDNPLFEGEDIFFWVIVNYPQGNGCGGIISEAAKVTVLEDPLLSSPSPATQEICQDSSSECLTGTATGGVGSYTFTWYDQDGELQLTDSGSEINGVMTSEFCPPTDEVGTFEYYYVVTTDALGAGCETTSSSAQVIVTPGPSFVTQPLETQTVCEGGTPQSFYGDDDDVSGGGVGEATYQWYRTLTCDTSDLSDLIAEEEGGMNAYYAPPGTLEGTFYYFVVVSYDQGGCESITSQCAEVIVVPDPLVEITSPLSQTICIGGDIGLITTSVSGGVGAIDYDWTITGPGVTPTSYSGGIVTTYNPTDVQSNIFDTAGVYQFFVTATYSGSGCDPSISDVVTVTVLEDPLLSSPSPATQEICQDSSPECLIGTASGGVGSYTFKWYDQDGELQLTDSGSEINGVMTSAFCPPTDEIGTFDYYYVVTTDASDADCETTSASAQVIVTPGPSFVTQPLETQTVCQDDSTQELTVTPENGVGTPLYQWHKVNDICDNTPSEITAIDGADQPTYTPPSIEPGTFYYFVVVSYDQGGCESIVSECAEVVIKPIAKIPDVVVEICDLNSYTLSPQNGLIPDVDTVVPTGTTYTWTYTNNSNIIGDNGNIIEEVSEIDYPQGVGAPGAFDSGTLDNDNPLFNVVETAIFEVTPWTDGCPGSPFTIAIDVSPEPDINEEIINIDCSYSEQLCAGAIEVNPVGIAPFTYNWTSPTPGIIINNPSDKDQIDLCPGMYELTITDDSNCSYNYSYEIAPPEPISFNLISLTDISCNNIDQLPCDGNILVEPIGGTGPYPIVEWYRDCDGDGDFDGPFATDTYELINLCACDYLLKIVDANGCEFISPTYTIEEGVESIVINETLSNYNGYNIDCYGANSGSISIDISGGSGVFEYEFLSSTPDGENTISGNYDIQVNNGPLVFSFLFGGEDFNYTFTLLDSNCPNEIVREYTLTQPEELIISAELVNPAICFGDVATYLVTASGGLPPYVGDGLIEVQGGPVTFTVTDTNDCQDEFSTVVPEPEQVLSTFNVEDALCFEGLGTVTITPIGGTPLLIVNIYDHPSGNPAIVDGQSPSQNTSSGLPVNFNLPNGNYYYEVLDSNQCKYGPEFFSIDEPDPLNIIDVEVLNPDCNTNPAWEFNNGSICITLIGGTDPFPIGSGWINNGNGQWCLENLSEGIYSIDATDINDCSLENIIPDITLTTPPEITVSFNDTLTIDCDTNTATQTNFIFIDGGVPPYEITWSGGNPVPPNAMEATESGDYSAFVNDQYGISNGCPPIEFPLDPIVLSEFGVPDFSFNSLNSDFCGIFSVGEPINFQNTSTGDIVNFTWNFGDGSPSVSGDNNPSHTYDSIGSYTVDLTVEDVYGCFDTYSETIDITKGYGIILPTAFTPNGDGINETIRPVYNCMTDVSMRIYDTWGSLLYQESGETIYGWDGTINGNSAENGNYIIVVIAQTFNGKTLELNGPITLIK
jgi:gliding motility-associated-like protein